MMKRKLLLLLLCIAIPMLLHGCAARTGSAVCERYLAAIAAGDYAAAYDLLSATVKSDAGQESSRRISQEAFVQRYTDIFTGLQISGADYAIQGESAGEILCRVNYTLTYHSAIAGEMTYQYTMNLIRENRAWWVEWEPALLFPAMEWGDTVRVGTLPASRGEILADNNVLAQNLPLLSVYAVPSKAGDPDALAARLAPLLQESAQDIPNALNKATNDFAIIAQMYPDQMDAVTREQLLLIPGVGIDTRNFGTKRHYPQGSLLAHTIGYTRLADEASLAYIAGKWPELAHLYTTDSTVGMLGLERMYEGELRGTDGKSIFIADAQGGTRETLYTQPAQHGADLNLTVNYELQKRVETVLDLTLYGDTMAGAVVVLNPLTGAVEAIASYPAYNLNSFARGISSQEYSQLLAMPNKPLNNRATQGLYPPGSSFKPFTAALALEAGSMSADEVLQVDIQDDKWTPSEFGTWTWASITRAHMNYRTEPLNMHNAMINSDNIYFAYTALNTGRDAFLDFSDRLGMTQSIPFDLAVAPPQVYNVDEAAGLSAFNLMLLADSGYGQGEMLVTPLQLASMFCLFANGGSIVTPHIVEGMYCTVDGDYTCAMKAEPGFWRENAVDSHIVDTIGVMLEHVVSRDYNGTGRNLKVTSCTVRGKTGTAEVGFDKSREISWFVGFRAGEHAQSAPRLVLVMLEVPAGDKYSQLKLDVARELLKLSAP